MDLATVAQTAIRRASRGQSVEAPGVWLLGPRARHLKGRLAAEQRDCRILEQELAGVVLYTHYT